MKAVTCHQGELAVAELPDPVPGPGQVLLEVTRCGICGSDLHARKHGDEIAGVMSELGWGKFMRSEQTVVLGHEFCGRVLDYGPKTRRAVPTGADVTALPLLRGTAGGFEPLAGGDSSDRGVNGTGLCAEAPGAYAERVLVEESLMLAVPNGLSVDISGMTEPMAVGWHAVRRSEIGKRQTAIVIGCGPIGCAVILGLKARGVRTIVASDFSAARRELALRCGATHVVDPAQDSPYTVADKGHFHSIPDLFEMAVGTTEKLRRLPGGIWHGVFRAVDAAGLSPRGPVVFECVGVPGMIDSVIAGAPIYSRVVVVGVCMGNDAIRPTMAINKEIDLRFVLGYTPLEFRDTLHMLAEGKLDPSPLITGHVGLDGVAAAFDALGDPARHAKILIDPTSPATAP